MYNNDNNDIGDRVPPSIKLQRKKIRDTKIKEQKENISKTIPVCTRNIFPKLNNSDIKN